MSLEADIRRALNRHKSKLANKRPVLDLPPKVVTRVELSVRRGGTGMILKFLHEEHTLSRTVAEIAAVKEAGKQGLVLHCVLDIQLVEIEREVASGK